MALCVEENPDVNSARPKTLQHLASVSSGWLKAIKSTPSLWAVIDAAWNQQTIQLFLRKPQVGHTKKPSTGSGGHRSSGSYPGEHPNFNPMAISNVSDFEVFGAITCHQSREGIIHMDRHDARALGLRPSGLSRNAPTCKQVMEVIAQSPQLEIISLSEWTDPGEDPDTVVEPIHLPRLHTLCCENVPSSIQYAIAHNVVAPDCQLIEFGFCPTQEEAVQLDLLHNFTNGIGDRLQSFIQTQNRATITFSGSDITLSSRNYDPYSSEEGGVNIKFRVGWDLEPQLPLLRWMSTQIPEHADLTIKASEEILVEGLQIFSASSSIICSDWSFGTLAKPIVSDSQVSWPLPHLRKLDLRNAEMTVKEFKEFVWDRWGTCDKTHTQMERRLGIMLRPRALEVLKLPHGFAPKVSKAEKHALANCLCRKT